MREIFILAEHRQGQIRDITFEMLTKGRDLAEKIGADLTVLLLGYSKVKDFANILSEYSINVLVVEDTKLENFNSETYQKVLERLMGERKPLLTLIGHSSFGVDLAPSLAISLNTPLATDCIGLEFENDALIVTRQMYSGKVNARTTVRKSEGYIITVRQGVFTVGKPAPMGGEIIEVSSPLSGQITEKRFIEYVLPPPGGVDITAAEVLVSVGRGVRDENNMPMVEELAKVLGGVLACSRPVVDRGFLPSTRQVGMSGKTVKPKLYMAIGISGAFQHVLGMKNSDLIIAINKDPEAPIFNFADYGVVEDLLKIVPVLKGKISELRTQRA